jgi:uncharacterized protein
MYKRPVFKKLSERVAAPRNFIQILAGPRQTGKTTLVRQMMEESQIPAHYATADEPALKDLYWIDQQWEIGRMLTQGGKSKALLVLDEIQKISGWSETIKRLWDEDTHSGSTLQVLLLGSSPLLMKTGLTESLAGRFEIIPITHWSYQEMRDAFGFTLDEFLIFGGYPGAAVLIENPPRWKRYILDSLVETTISRDIMLMERIHKPELLRRLFELGCQYSGQILSYQKMVGQLQDAGNTTTLAHYLDLLGKSGLIQGLSKYAGEKVRIRASSPKLIVLNTALMTTSLPYAPDQIKENQELWGRLVESAVGSHLANSCPGQDIGLHYWSGNNREVDFVLTRGKNIAAIEVKSTVRKTKLSGMADFCRQFSVQRKLLIGAQGIPLEEFFLAPVEHWVG